jgi:AraC-like DNA-binding protein
LFSRFDYESPYQYLTRLKMIHAAEQLQMPGALVKQVAGQLGFGDPFRFSRTFRRVLGVSPKKFAQLRSL